MKRPFIYLSISINLLFAGCENKEAENSFSFAFISDSHITSNLASIREWELPDSRESLVEAPFIGYQKVLNEINEKSVDFILTGGDNIDLMTYELPPIDGKLPVSDDTMEVRKYVKRMREIEMSVGLPVYYTIGNHDCYVYPPAKPDDPLYGQGLFAKYFGQQGKTYYSFDKNGWHFIVLSTHDEQDKNSPNMMGVSSEQIEWLKNDLDKISKETPVVLSAHAPFPINKGYEEESKIIYQVIKNYNVKVALFGHWHGYHEFTWHDIPCVVGSSLSGAVWSEVRNVHDATYHDNADQGYLIISVAGSNVTWKHYPFSYSIEKYFYEKTGKRPDAFSEYWFSNHKK